MLITEGLTAFRYELLKKAKAAYGDKNVWTSDGQVFTKIDTVLMLISSENDLQ